MLGTLRFNESGRGQPHSKTCRNSTGAGMPRSVLECGCPLCTLHGSFISNAEVCRTTRSPSPRPSPRGEGEAPPDPRTLPGHTIRRLIGDDPPSPCLPSRSVLAKAGGEGQGGGNGLRMVQLAAVREMRVRCCALCRFVTSVGDLMLLIRPRLVI